MVLPECHQVGKVAVVEHDGKELVELGWNLGHGGFLLCQVPVCVTLEHASLLASLTVGLTELPSNGAKLLKGLWPSDFEEQHSEEEALKLIRVHTVHPSKHFRTLDAKLTLNCLTLLPALPLLYVRVPGVVRGDLPVEDSAGKVILLARLEESGEGRVL